MKTKTISRIFMIAAGLLAAVVILFSQSFYQQSELVQKKDSDNKAKSEKVIISAPSDAVTSNTLVNRTDNTTPETQPFFSAAKVQSLFKVESRVFINFFSTLFRVIISPNAP